MGKLLIQSLGCPNCGAPYESNSRYCPYCSSVLIVTSIAATFNRNLEAHQISESVAKWRKCLKGDPENSEAHFALGLSYLNSNLRDAALEHLRKAALLAPEFADTHYNLAVTLINDGNIVLESPEYTEAMKEIDYSTRLAPDFKESIAFKHFFLARKLDTVDNREALEEYYKAVEVCPDIAILQNNLGLCYLNSKIYDEAEICFDQVISLDPDYYLAYSNLCYLMYLQKKYERGIKFGMKAISLMGPATLEESQAFAYNNLALCLWKSKRKPEALENIKKAIALDPSNPLFKHNLKAIQKDCFIVTATMGDYSHPWVIELSVFRDHVLAKSNLGRCFIYCYSHVGPIFAQLIHRSLVLRQFALFFVVIPALFIARLSFGTLWAKRCW